jgi:hypothetical protein
LLILRWHTVVLWINVVLKVLHVTTQEATEYINLRTGSNLSLNYSSNDVKWGNNGDYRSVLNTCQFMIDLRYLF